MFDIKPDDLFKKDEQLLYLILQELKQLNKSLHPIAKDTEIKKKSKPKTVKSKPKLKPKLNSEVQDGNTNH